MYILRARLKGHCLIINASLQPAHLIENDHLKIPVHTQASHPNGNIQISINHPVKMDR
jgi:hypothetical protein